METALKVLDNSKFQSRKVSEVIAGDITFFTDFQGGISYIRVREDLTAVQEVSQINEDRTAQFD